MPQRSSYLVNKTFKSYLLATVLASVALSFGVVVDGIIVGNLLGAEALSAVNLVAPVMQFFNALYLLMNVGGGILVAAAIGKRKFDDVNRIFSFSVVLNLLVGFLLVVTGIFFLDEVVRMLCSDQVLQPLVRDYVKIVLLTSPVYIILPGLCVYVRTDSNPKLASLALIVANVLNVGLDILFISGFSMGIAGASLATAIGFMVGVAIVCTHFFKKKRIIHFRKPTFNSKVILTGLPLALASILMTVRLLSVNSIVLDNLGVTGISILSVCFNILMISSMFISGTVQAMQPIASVLYGAEDYKGVHIAVKAALKTLAICLLCLLVLLLIFPGFFASLFGLSVLAEVKSAIRLFAFCVPLFGLNYLIMAVFQLNGRNGFSIVVSCTQALMTIPVMLLATLFNNEALIWLSFVLGEIFVFVIIWIISQNVRRKNSNLSPITLIDSPQYNESVLDFSIQGSIDKIEESTGTIHRFLLEKNINEGCRNAVEVCVEELVLNIVQHGFSGKRTHYIDIRLRIISDKILLCITDDGIPFDPVKYDKSGIGLLLVRKLCSDIQYSYSLNMNVVVVEIKI